MDTRLHGYDKLPPLRLSGFARDPLSSLTPSGGGWLMFMNYVKIFQPGALSTGYSPVPCVTLSALTPALSRRFIIAVQILLPGRGGITLTIHDNPSPCTGYMQYRDLNIYAGIIL